MQYWAFTEKKDMSEIKTCRAYSSCFYSLKLLSVRNQVAPKLVAAPSCEDKFASCAITFKAHQTTLFGESGRIKVCTTKIQN